MRALIQANLFFASTPLIALEAAGAARAQGGRARLVLLEDFDLADRLSRLLERWPDNPFEKIERLPGRHTEHARGAGDRQRGASAFLHRVAVKRDIRRQTLARLRALDEEFQPDAVWVGNDRKVETQFALHLASQRAGAPAGRYLDDGLYTYLGDVRQRPFVRRMDWAVKRLTYGRWWHRADQAGTSPWIAQAWLAFPEDAADQSPQRERRTLPRDWFRGRPFLRLSALAAREFAVDRPALRRCAIVLVMPHSNQLRAEPALAAGMLDLVRRAGERGQWVALKYHPREVDPDPGGLLASGQVIGLPALLPMELLLPLLPNGATLAGEGSTALLAAGWLRPDLRVFDLGHSREGYAARARPLLAKHGIASLGGDPAALLG